MMDTFVKLKNGSLKYGLIVHTGNTIEEEIKERIALGNKAFFANK
jgi:hypothetical protein